MIKQDLTSQLKLAFDQAGFVDADVSVQFSTHPELADYQCNAALPYAKKAKTNPRVIADAVVAQLSGFKEVSVAGPGFINLRLTDDYLVAQTLALLKMIDKGMPLNTAPKTVILDFGGPNMAKSMHVGHLRSAIIGESLKRIFNYCGDKTIGDIHLGDWGTPLGMLIAQIQEQHSDLHLDLDAINALYKAAAARFKEDDDFKEQARQVTLQLQQGDADVTAIWHKLRQQSVENIRHLFDSLGVSFDRWDGESDVQDVMPEIVEDLKNKGLLVLSEGAWIVPRTGDAPDLAPTIIQKQNGGYTYAATDVATIYKRVKAFNPDAILYVVDNRQSEHLEQVFEVARTAGYVGDHVSLEHIPFGTINDTSGKPFKTRSGKSFSLADLLQVVREKSLATSGLSFDDVQGKPGESEIAEQVAMGAVKYQDLKNNRTSNYIFDLDQFSAFEGNTGPYLQYAIVRTNAILRKAGDINFSDSLAIRSEVERELILIATRFPEIISITYHKREPSEICKFAYTLAKKFSSFYDAHHILKEQDQQTLHDRLLLVSLVNRILKQCLALLSIGTPVKMLSASHT